MEYIARTVEVRYCYRNLVAKAKSKIGHLGLLDRKGKNQNCCHKSTYLLTYLLTHSMEQSTY